MKAVFSIIEVTDNLVLIRDEARRLDRMSVTNDAEAVVADLNETGASGDRIIYYIDTDDRVDILEHDNCGNFLGFKRGYSNLEEFYENFELIK